MNLANLALERSRTVKLARRLTCVLTILHIPQSLCITADVAGSYRQMLSDVLLCLKKIK